MRTPDQRGRYGRWLVAAREARGWDTAQKALDAMAVVGIRIGKSTYAEYEAGTKAPSRNHLPLLESFWGPVPEPVEATQSRDQLAEAVMALVAEMRAQREQDREEGSALIRFAESVAALAQQRETVEA